MRIAIVDDLDTERTLLKERLVRQLSQRGADAELLEFDSGEAFLAAEKEQRFEIQENCHNRYEQQGERR